MIIRILNIFKSKLKINELAQLDVTIPFACNTHYGQKVVSWLFTITCDFQWIPYISYEKKAMDKATVKEIRKGKQKEREDKWARKVVDSLTMKEQVVRRIVEKCVIT